MEILQGADGLNATLIELGRKAAGKIGRKALRDGAKIIAAEARATAPRRTGLLARSIKVRAGKKRRGSIALNVTIDKGFYKGEAFYGAFVEFGHRQGPRKLGNARKMIPGKHFLQNAFAAKASAATATIIDSLKAGIDAAATTANSAK